MLEDALDFANLAETFSKQDATKQSKPTQHHVKIIIHVFIIHDSCTEERQEKQCPRH